MEEHKERCHNYLESAGMDPTSVTGPYPGECECPALVHRDLLYGISVDGMDSETFAFSLAPFLHLAL